MFEKNPSRLEFTKKMKKDYTILIPDMLTIHFKLLERLFNDYGYKVKVLYNQGRPVVDEGLKYVHNDTCYPALLVIGQMINALNSGEYDVNKTALMISQTGGGCRASNYIHLLRKALTDAGYGHVPVISLNFAGLESNSGFKITLPLLRRAMAAISYGDFMMLMYNQIRPYEINKGESDALVNFWVNKVCDHFKHGKDIKSKDIRFVLHEIAEDFAAIPIKRTPKIKVGIVGEIYVKYAPLGNNNLEQFLYEQGCEVMVPGLLDFLMYSIYNSSYDYKLYGGSWFMNRVLKIAFNYLNKIKRMINITLSQYIGFTVPSDFQHIIKLADGVISHGVKMGEGWFLTAEMLELIELGYSNIVCVQPFGCLPNHIVGRGMLRKIKSMNDAANIVPVDYDPGATKVNQENRIKLMLSIARENMRERQSDNITEISQYLPAQDIIPAQTAENIKESIKESIK